MSVHVLLFGLHCGGLGKVVIVLLLHFIYRIVENFRGEKLSHFGTKREFHGENLCGLLCSNYYVGVATKFCGNREKRERFLPQKLSALQ